MTSIAEFIPKGRENAISRASLAAMLNLPDRTVRQMIEKARREGEIIINLGSGEGYYISEDPADIQRQMKMNNSRAMAILVQQTHLRRKLRELEGSDQIEMEEVADIG